MFVLVPVLIMAVYGIYFFLRPALEAIANGDETLKGFTLPARIAYFSAMVLFWVVVFAAIAIIQGA